MKANIGFDVKSDRVGEEYERCIGTINNGFSSLFHCAWLACKGLDLAFRAQWICCSLGGNLDHYGWMDFYLVVFLSFFLFAIQHLPFLSIEFDFRPTITVPLNWVG